MPLKHAGIADEQRSAGAAHGGIERSLEADLRSNARRIADGNGNSRLFAHAWTLILYIGCIARTCEGVFITESDSSNSSLSSPQGV
jgi:hypothetical protein